MKGRTNFSRRLQAARNRDCWLEVIDVGCNLKQFDGLTWLTLTPRFYDRSTPLYCPTSKLRSHSLCSNKSFNWYFSWWLNRLRDLYIRFSSFRAPVTVYRFAVVLGCNRATERDPSGQRRRWSECMGGYHTRDIIICPGRSLWNALPH